jgi:hypothetical protein
LGICRFPDAVFEHYFMQLHVIVIELLFALAPFSDHRDEVSILRKQVSKGRDVMSVPGILPVGFDIPNGFCIGWLVGLSERSCRPQREDQQCEQDSGNRLVNSHMHLSRLSASL